MRVSDDTRAEVESAIRQTWECMAIYLMRCCGITANQADAVVAVSMERFVKSYQRTCGDPRARLPPGRK